MKIDQPNQERKAHPYESVQDGQHGIAVPCAPTYGVKQLPLLEQPIYHFGQLRKKFPINTL